MKLEGSDTQKNLWAAFNAESSASMKYRLYSEAAKQSGYRQIAAIFEETADNEMQHAAMWLYTLGEISPAASAESVSENLKKAAAGENMEWTKMYREFSETAEKEGFKSLAKDFIEIASVEEAHEKRYNTLIGNLAKGLVFHRPDGQTVWQCRNCGYLHIGSDAPEICPACKHPREYFQLFVPTY